MLYDRFMCSVNRYLDKFFKWNVFMLIVDDLLKKIDVVCLLHII